MNHFRSSLLVIFTLLSIAAFACSGYKITKKGRTLFGSNEDAWRTTSRIWFENKTDYYLYGAAFTGSRYDGKNGFAPQSGMNEKGLVFERLASYAPDSKSGLANRQKITNPTLYLKEILHNCATVEEAKAFIEKYDYSYFLEDVFLYADKSGKYLIVEPFKLTIGDEATYVISNFCPSATSPEQANRLDRYRNGKLFLKDKLETSLEFATALSDTMHVCREKIGDGTLLTSIWNLNDGTVNLYFYHDYKTTVSFNIADELAKGDHILAIDTLFPENAEFEKLKKYQTPQNNIRIGMFLVFSGVFFLLSALTFLIMYIRKRKFLAYKKWLLFLVPMGLISCYYLFFLVTNMNVFYFASPYVDYYNSFNSVLSYFPFVLIAVIVPLWIVNIKTWREKSWSWFAKSIFLVNNVLLMALIGFFYYWGFYGFN